MNTRPITSYERQILRAYALDQGVAAIAAAHNTDADLILRQLIALCSFNRYAARAVVIAGQVRDETPVAVLVDLRWAPRLAAVKRDRTSPAISTRRGHEGDPLNEREQAILELMAAGEDDTAIAARLHISRHTVKYNMSALYAKLGVRNRAAAIAAAPRPTDTTATVEDGAPTLTDREREVLDLLAAGRTNKEIGVHLGMSDGTVRTHVGRVIAKLNAPSRGLAVAEAIRRGLVTPPGDPHGAEIRRLAALAAS